MIPLRLALLCVLLVILLAAHDDHLPCRKWMKERLASSLVGLKTEHDGYTMETTRLSKCDGESRTLVVRGKKRAGFEFHLELHWTGLHHEYAVKSKSIVCT